MMSIRTSLNLYFGHKIAKIEQLFRNNNKDVTKEEQGGSVVPFRRFLVIYEKKHKTKDDLRPLRISLP